MKNSYLMQPMGCSLNSTRSSLDFLLEALLVLCQSFEVYHKIPLIYTMGLDHG